MEIASVGTVGMRVPLRQRGTKDYALLNAEWMVYISFVISAFKNVFVLLMLKKIFLYIFFIYLLLLFFFGFSRFVRVLRMWSVLVCRSAK